MIRRPSWILLKKWKKEKQFSFLLRATGHTLKIKFELYSHSYQILIIAKMSKTEKAVKILKSRKMWVFFIIITQKTNQHTSRVGLFLWTKDETNPWSSSSSRKRHRILGGHLEFCWKLKIAKKIYWANSVGPICILQIFRNNPSSGV